MKKKFKFFCLACVTTLALVLVGCSSNSSNKSTINSEGSKTADSYKTGPAASFDWNAKVAPTSYERTFVETNSGSQINKTLNRTKEASKNLENMKKEISDPKVQAALKLVDAVFINQENFDLVVKAAGASSQEELFANIWQDSMLPELLKRYSNFSADTVFEHKGEKYPLEVYAPMYFKVNTNALGKAGAYTIEDYKVEGEMVYLQLSTPSVDTYQYEVKASYNKDQTDFLRKLADEHHKIAKTNPAQGMNTLFLYRLVALDFKADNYVDLVGMDYLENNTHYLAIKVNSEGETSIDMNNLVNLLQINMKPAGDANKGKFQ